MNPAEEEHSHIVWEIVDKYFHDNPYNLVAHHLDSVNDFWSKGVYKIIKENNPIRFMERSDDPNIKETAECYMFIGGIDGTKLYFGKPMIYDDKDFSHYMYPNDARLRNMTYGMTVHYDVDIIYKYYENGEKKEHKTTLQKVFLGKYPIMLQSNQCILKGLAKEAAYNLGECRYDYGGYFIIDGGEKVVVSQEHFGDNMLYVRAYKDNDLNEFSHSCEVRSVSEDASKPIRYTSVKRVFPDSKYTNEQIVVDIPNVRKPVPLFILFRALGVISDKDIIRMCLLDIEQNANMMDLFIPSIHDAHTIFTQKAALEFIASFTKRQTVSSCMDILMNYFLPHIGENNFINKAYFLGFMVKEMLLVYMGKKKPTDRDNFKFKRVELTGELMYGLFREYYLLQKQSISMKLDKEYYYHVGKYKENFTSLIEDNVKLLFDERVVETGFRKGFKGNWGATAQTKRVGVLQALNRLSYFTVMSHLRKVNLPMEASAKVVGPHLLHSTQWGIIDPIDTPDGGNVGLHKHLAMSATVTNGYSSFDLIRWMRKNIQLKYLQEGTTEWINVRTKVFVNGNWVGVLENPLESMTLIKLYRRNGVLPAYTSISFDYGKNILYAYTDAGRLVRPLFYMDENPLLTSKGLREKILSGKFSWAQLIAGFQAKPDSFDLKSGRIYNQIQDLYPSLKNGDIIDTFKQYMGIIDYVDTSETECLLIANSLADAKQNKYTTHIEMDKSLLLGVMGNSIIFPENNPVARNVFSCGQSRQAVSMFHTNFQMRMDKMMVVLNSGQCPLTKSRYLDYINHEEMPYGVNAIVAIMCYTGYNVEDAILINEGSLKRGIFRTTYYTTYETHEESSKVSGTTLNTVFANVQAKQNVAGIKAGYDYGYLDDNGLIKENTPMHDKLMVIGKLSYSTDNKSQYFDGSYAPKKGQLGYVDKSFITEGEEGMRVAKVRVREERIPAVGDKMASRAGQKGTIGLIIPEENMPFTGDGLNPDLIVNPHAFPSRMTLGHQIEVLSGLVGANYGHFQDCTAFNSMGPGVDVHGTMLQKMGYHSAGIQLLHDGHTGKMMEANIYFGPTYYMRLKHMVKDKINYRAKGPNEAMTRQPVHGRANDGGLRLGEMERDGVLAHGCSHFLQDAFMNRADEYYLAICNLTGMVAIYNPDIGRMLSPMADGPLVFTDSMDGSKVLTTHSVHGRSFSVVPIPYSAKVQLHELMAIGVQMRIITDANVDQLMNLSYNSGNVYKLKQVDEDSTDLKTLIEAHYKTYMNKGNKEAVAKELPVLQPESNKAVKVNTPEIRDLYGDLNASSSVSEPTLADAAKDDVPYADVSPAMAPPSSSSGFYSTTTEASSSSGSSSGTDSSSSGSSSSGSTSYTSTASNSDSSPQFDMNRVYTQDIGSVAAPQQQSMQGGSDAAYSVVSEAEAAEANNIASYDLKQLYELYLHQIPKEKQEAIMKLSKEKQVYVLSEIAKRLKPQLEEHATNMFNVDDETENESSPSYNNDSSTTQDNSTNESSVKKISF